MNSTGLNDCLVVNITRGNHLYETCYTFHSNEVNLTEAAARCYAEGHTLVQDDAAQVHDLLTSYLTGRISGDLKWREVWLGARQTGWVWANSENSAGRYFYQSLITT